MNSYEINNDTLAILPKSENESIVYESDNKYIVAGNNLSVERPTSDSKISGDYFEITYIKDGYNPYFIYFKYIPTQLLIIVIYS